MSYEGRGGRGRALGGSASAASARSGSSRAAAHLSRGLDEAVRLRGLEVGALGTSRRAYAGALRLRVRPPGHPRRAPGGAPREVAGVTSSSPRRARTRATTARATSSTTRLHEARARPDRAGPRRLPHGRRQAPLQAPHGPHLDSSRRRRLSRVTIEPLVTPCGQNPKGLQTPAPGAPAAHGGNDARSVPHSCRRSEMIQKLPQPFCCSEED